MKKILLAIILIILPILSFGDYALFNSKGEALTDFSFTNIFPFMNDRALVQKDENFSYIDKLGTHTTSHAYALASQFHNNIAIVKKDNKIFYINKSHTPIFKEDFSAYTPNTKAVIEVFKPYTKSDLLIVEKAKKCGIAKPDGTLVIPCEYDRIINCDGEIFLAEKNGFFGYINKENKVIIPFAYQRASEFKDGFACVTKNGKTFVINQSNEQIAKDCDSYFIYSNNVILATKGEKIGGFDKTGKQIIAFEYSLNSQGDFKNIKHNLMVKPNGCFILYKKDSYFLFNKEGVGVNNIKATDITDFEKATTIASTGQYIVDIFGKMEFKTYKDAKEYVDGLKVKMVTEMENKYSLIKPELNAKILDKNWKILCEPTYSDVKDVYENTFVAKQDKYGIVGIDGKVILPFEYDDLANGEIIVGKKGKAFGLINREGVEICQFVYDNISDFVGDFAVVKKGEKFGVINSKGKEILPTIYSDINIFPEDLDPTKDIFFAVGK